MLQKPLTWLVIMFVGLAAITANAIFIRQDHMFDYSKDFPEILQFIDAAYVDEVDLSKLMPGAFQGAMEKVAPNASYIPAEMAPVSKEAELYKKTGLVLHKKKGHVAALVVVDGSPAAVAGIKKGAYFRTINGQSSSQLSYFEACTMLAEEEDHQLRILNPNEMDSKDVTLTHGKFSLPSLAHVTYSDGIHLIKFPLCDRENFKDLNKVLKRIKPEERVVLDLRDNVSNEDKDLLTMAEKFLPQGKLASLKDNKNAPIDLVNMKAADANYQLYLLVDESTSGAMEIFAAAAQAKVNAKIIGIQTLGIHRHMKMIQLKSGAHIEIPVKNVFTAKDQKLSGVGLTPDMDVTLEKEELEQAEDIFLSKALEMVRKPPLKKAS